MNADEKKAALKQITTMFKNRAPVLNEDQRGELRECWYLLKDRVYDIEWRDDMLDENGDMTERAVEEMADHTLSALGCAMLAAYDL